MTSGAILSTVLPLDFGVLAQEVLAQQRDVVLALHQGRDLQGDHVDAVVEVLAEVAPLHFALQVLVGGGQDPEIHGDFRGAAHPHQGLFLEHPQQLDLHGGGHLADLVQEDGAAGGDLQQPFLHPPGPGEGLLFVAEELVGQQFLAEGAAVDGQKAFFGPQAQVVDGLGHQFLAGAGLAQDEDGGVGGGDLFDGLLQDLDLGALAHQDKALPAGSAPGASGR